MQVTHLEVRRHPTWQAESRQSQTVPGYRALTAERQKRRLVGVSALVVMAAAALFLAM
jgi:hypothetical protein